MPLWIELAQSLLLALPILRFRFERCGCGAKGRVSSYRSEIDGLVISLVTLLTNPAIGDMQVEVPVAVGINMSAFKGPRGAPRAGRSRGHRCGQWGQTRPDTSGHHSVLANGSFDDLFRMLRQKTAQMCESNHCREP